MIDIEVGLSRSWTASSKLLLPLKLFGGVMQALNNLRMRLD